MPTVTASVIPAARPAAWRDLLSALGLRTEAEGSNEESQFSLSLLTTKNSLVCQSAITWIGQSGIGKHRLVFLETQKAYAHLGYDADEDGSEAFVKGKWGLSSDSHDGIDQALCLTLGRYSDERNFEQWSWSNMVHLTSVARKQNVRQLTLAFGSDEESCMLTLTVSGPTDEERVLAIGSKGSPYPEDDMSGPPSFLLHHQLYTLSNHVSRQGQTQELAD